MLPGYFFKELNEPGYCRTEALNLDRHVYFLYVLRYNEFKSGVHGSDKSTLRQERYGK